MMNNSDLFARASEVIPGGVNSPVRAFKSVGGSPPFVARGSGCRVVDAEGSEYIDLVMSWGPLILGHAHPEIVESVRVAAAHGTSFGAPTEGEVRLAELIVELVPSIEKVRLVSSGTEATMSAARLARAATGRDAIVKFEGCYHGHGDSFLIKAGSGAMTLGAPSSPGVPKSLAADTLVARYNDLDSVARLFDECGERIACIFVEPIAGNMGVVPPAEGFLEGLRSITRQHDALLVFDEVISGFRVGLGGAQQHYGITPDLTTLGKVIGGGLPVGAFGGRADLMDLLAPAGDVYQAGTLSGNPLAVAAGTAVLEILVRDNPYEELARKAQRLFDGIAQAAADARVPVAVNRVGSIGTVFFTDKQVDTYDRAAASDTRRFASYHAAMLERGVYLPPSQFEALFVSTAHGDDDIDEVMRCACESLVAGCTCA
ncbi:MAG: glutamate-1-semialdehyde 2,1-aminomutase [Chitinivibrionales bacterium]|nr:glutamate-1-semialdehyde 2,1-aminomutase [Chitinivibrionales bacterium]